MAKYDVEVNGGRYRIELPDDHTQEELTRTVRSIEVHTAAPDEFTEAGPARGRGTLQFGPWDTGLETAETAQNALAGAGKWFSDIGRGSEQAIMSARYTPDQSSYLRGLNERIDEQKTLDEPLMGTTAGKAGYIGGAMASTLPLGAVGANSYLVGAGIGGGMNAMLPVATGESRLLNTGVGAVGGAVGTGLGKAAGAVLRARQPDKLTTYAREVETPTLPSLFGRGAQRTEDAMTSTAVAGDIIAAGRRSSGRKFERAALNRVLEPLKQKVTRGGLEGLQDTHATISGVYDDLVDTARYKIDNVAVRSMKRVIDHANRGSRTQPPLPRELRGDFNDIAINAINRLAEAGGRAPGRVFKELDSMLGSAAANAGARQGGGPLAHELRSLQSVLRKQLARSNPGTQIATRMRAADKAYSRLLRVERAMGYQGAQSAELMTPTQLNSAIKAMDRSRNKRLSNQGLADMQDLALAGMRYLRPTVANSGTADRLLRNPAGVAYGAMLAPLAVAGNAPPLRWATRQALYARGPLRPAGDLLWERAAAFGGLGGGMAAQTRGRQE